MEWDPAVGYHADATQFSAASSGGRIDALPRACLVGRRLSSLAFSDLYVFHVYTHKNLNLVVVILKTEVSVVCVTSMCTRVFSTRRNHLD